MTNKTVSIHVPARKEGLPEYRYIDDGLGKWGRPALVAALRNEGMEAVFSRGAAALSPDGETIQILKPEVTSLGEGQYEVAATPEKVSIDSIDVFRNVTAPLGHGLPELNQLAVRTAARDKVAANEIIVAGGVPKIFTAWNPSDGPGVLDLIPGERVAMKPRYGKRSEGVFLGTKQEVRDIMSRLEPESMSVLEEYLDTTAPLRVKGVDEVQQEIIDTGNREGRPKELRCYMFGHENDELQRYFVLRMGAANEDALRHDTWVYIDQASVPEEIQRIVKQVERKFQTVTGVGELHAAIDIAPVRTPDGIRYVPMEINASEPQLVYEHQNAEVARTLNKMLARQLSRVANKGFSEGL